MYYYNSIVCIQIHTTTASRVLNEKECVSGENERKIYGKSIFFTTATSAFFLHTLMLLTQNFLWFSSTFLKCCVPFEIEILLHDLSVKKKNETKEEEAKKGDWRLLGDVGAIINYVTCEQFLDFCSTWWNSWILNAHGKALNLCLH